jgi:hypothetical protein
MPLLGALVTSLFGGIATFFAGFIAKKAAFALAAVATFAALTVAFVAAIQAVAAGITVAFPESSPIILSLIWVVLPDNAALCVTACIGADTAVALYRWNSENVRLASMVS